MWTLTVSRSFFLKLFHIVFLTNKSFYQQGESFIPPQMDLGFEPSLGQQIMKVIVSVTLVISLDIFFNWRSWKLFFKKKFGRVCKWMRTAQASERINKQNFQETIAAYIVLFTDTINSIEFSSTMMSAYRIFCGTQGIPRAMKVMMY